MDMLKELALMVLAAIVVLGFSLFLAFLLSICPGRGRRRKRRKPMRDERQDPPRESTTAAPVKAAH